LFIASPYPPRAKLPLVSIRSKIFRSSELGKWWRRISTISSLQTFREASKVKVAVLLLHLDQLRKYLLAAGLLLSLLTLSIQFGEDVERFFFFFIVFLTGIPHGSLDYFIEKKNSALGKRKLLLSHFLMKYIANMILYGIIWFYFPLLGFVIFILLASYHFGEIDWPVRKRNEYTSLLFTIYGLAFLLFIISAHLETTAPILERIVVREVSAERWAAWGQSVFEVTLVFLLIYILLLTRFYKNVGWDKAQRDGFFIQTIILMGILYMLPLYLGFGFYFGLWHSLLSLNLIRRQMNLESGRRGWSILVVKALPFTLIAWIGIFIFIFILGEGHRNWLIFSNVFMAIAILTLPHLQVFTRIKI